MDQIYAEAADHYNAKVMRGPIAAGGQLLGGVAAAGQIAPPQPLLTDISTRLAQIMSEMDDALYPALGALDRAGIYDLGLSKGSDTCADRLAPDDLASAIRGQLNEIGERIQRLREIRSRLERLA